jgi:hypothetical protein
MAKPQLSSLLVFGVDFGLGSQAPAWSEQVAIARQVLALLEQHQISATWALPQLRNSWISTLREARSRQEIALQWNDTVVAQASDAFAFAADMRARLRDAESQELKINSLAIDPRSRVPYHVLAKSEIRMVRPTRIRSTHLVRSVQPQVMRHGVWGLPVSSFWPQPNRILQQLSLQHLAYQMRLASQQGHVLHVVLDLPMIARHPEIHLGGAAKIMEQAACLQNAELLRSARLADVARLVQQETMARSHHSILRRSMQRQAS